MSDPSAIPEKKQREALIKFHMNLAGIKAAEIARRIERHKATVSREIQGAHRSRMIREAIARELGKPYQEIWGEE
jgi:IS30 family transposase